MFIGAFRVLEAVRSRGVYAEWPTIHRIYAE
jgi:hypothetical protein